MYIRGVQLFHAYRTSKLKRYQNSGTSVILRKVRHDELQKQHTKK